MSHQEKLALATDARHGRDLQASVDDIKQQRYNILTHTSPFKGAKTTPRRSQSKSQHGHSGNNSMHPATPAFTSNGLRRSTPPLSAATPWTPDEAYAYPQQQQQQQHPLLLALEAREKETEKEKEKEKGEAFQTASYSSRGSQDLPEGINNGAASSLSGHTSLNTSRSGRFTATVTGTGLGWSQSGRPSLGRSGSGTGLGASGRGEGISASAFTRMGILTQTVETLLRGITGGLGRTASGGGVDIGSAAAGGAGDELDGAYADEDLLRDLNGDYDHRHAHAAGARGRKTVRDLDDDWKALLSMSSLSSSSSSSSSSASLGSSSKYRSVHGAGRP